jgi:hypothetical protein
MRPSDFSVATIGVGSGRGAVVMAQQSAQEALAADAFDFRGNVECRLLRWPRCCRGQSPIPESLMRAVRIVEPDEFLADMVEVAHAEAQRIIEAFSLANQDT